MSELDPRRTVGPRWRLEPGLPPWLSLAMLLVFWAACYAVGAMVRNGL